MWTATTRALHKRDGLRFASDLTDAEWAVLEPLLPPPSAVGRPPAWPMRELVNAIFYVLRGGVAWRMLPDCFPPRQTVYGWFAAWRDAGVWQSITQHLVMLDRERVGREASPRAAVIDSQSVKTTEAGGPRGGACPRASEAGPVGRRQEGERSQAARPGRYRRPASGAAGSPRLGPGPRWGGAFAEGVAAPFPIHRACLCRLRLCWRAPRPRHQHCHRNRSQACRSSGICGPTTSLGG
jgi:transposase